MQTIPIPKNAFTARIIMIAVVGSALVIPGLLLLILQGEAMVPAFIAIALGATLFQLAALWHVITTLRCPSCGRQLKRKIMGPCFTCEPCQTQWQFEMTTSMRSRKMALAGVLQGLGLGIITGSNAGRTNSLGIFITIMAVAIVLLVGGMIWYFRLLRKAEAQPGNAQQR